MGAAKLARVPDGYSLKSAIADWPVQAIAEPAQFVKVPEAMRLRCNAANYRTAA